MKSITIEVPEGYPLDYLIIQFNPTKGCHNPPNYTELISKHLTPPVSHTNHKVSEIFPLEINPCDQLLSRGVIEAYLRSKYTDLTTKNYLTTLNGLKYRVICRIEMMKYLEGEPSIYTEFVANQPPTKKKVINRLFKILKNGFGH